MYVFSLRVGMSPGLAHSRGEASHATPYGVQVFGKAEDEDGIAQRIAQLVVSSASDGDELLALELEAIGAALHPAPALNCQSSLPVLES